MLLDVIGNDAQNTLDVIQYVPIHVSTDTKETLNDGLGYYVFEWFNYLIIIDAVLSWVQPPSAMPRKMTSSLTTAMYTPIHAIISPQKTGGIDFSPLILIFGIQFLVGLLVRL